ncbi:hypothetical protein IQ07DRAFT_523934 [Pyrenochaeta sp. DS3sAY3a]|nr:hypothetical protein IQ07DRAFT_523934 [Pyrenochaeta sp. DS3sAY3a]
MEVVDLDRFFDDHVETGMLHHFSDSTAGRSSSDDLATLFDISSSSDGDLFGTKSSLDREVHTTWHKAAENSEQQNPALSMPNEFSSFCIDPKRKETLSDSELLNFEDFFDLEHNQLRSISQPSTPRPNPATRSVKKAVSFNDRPISRGVQKTLKKSSSTSFSKMMQPMYYRQPIPDVWTRKMDAPTDSFSLRGHSNGITSPPLSSKIVQHENGNGFFSQDHQPYAGTRPSPPRDEPQTPGIDFSNYQLTPQASPAIGISNGNNPFNDNMGLSFSPSVSSAALSALQTPPSSLRIPMTTWGTEASPSLDFGFSTSPDFAGTGKSARWWNDDASLQSPACPNYRESHSRSTSQSMGLTNAAMSGLGISCDTASFNHFSGVGLGVSSVSESMPGPTASHSSAASSRRKSSNSSQQSSRNPSTGNVGFVNFTPDDSRKILTGVAPSGSSKTKARREKEAADKRRKLSQAAMKAVMEAGGDVDSLRRLEREGLLVLET